MYITGCLVGVLGLTIIKLYSCYIWSRVAGLWETKRKSQHHNKLFEYSLIFFIKFMVIFMQMSNYKACGLYINILITKTTSAICSLSLCSLSFMCPYF